MHYQLSCAPFILILMPVITFLIAQGAPSEGPPIGLCGFVLSCICTIAVAFQIAPAFIILVLHHGKTVLLPSPSAISYLRALMHSYIYANIKQI